jgi:hypothetical protein
MGKLQRRVVVVIVVAAAIIAGLCCETIVVRCRITGLVHTFFECLLYELERHAILVLWVHTSSEDDGEMFSAFFRSCSEVDVERGL